MVLPERMDIFFSTRIKETLLEALKIGDYVLDFKKVRILDTAGTQLLLSFIKTVDDREKIIFLNVSNEISGTINLLGIET